MSSSLCTLALVAIAAAEPAPSSAPGTDPMALIAQADALVDKGDPANRLAAIALYEQAAALAPQSYVAQWKAARGHREYAWRVQELLLPGAQAICTEHGRKGMQYAQRAMELNPKGAEGLLWYGSSAGSYADGVSIITAIREGLKDKTQQAFERAYASDPSYNDHGPVLGLGRFWSAVPWPFKDNAKGLKYLREYRARHPDNPEGLWYTAEVLLDEGGKENLAEARQLLDALDQAQYPYYRAQAKRLRDKL